MGRPPQFLVLLVDDEPVVRMAITAGIDVAGCTFVDAASVDDALEVRHRWFDVGHLLADVTVPGRLEKADLARLVRERRPEVRLVVTAGLPILSDQVPAEGRSARKTHQVGQVTQAINRLCGWAGSLGPRFP